MPAPVIPKDSRKAALIGWAASWLIRLISLTLRYTLSDPHGITKYPTDRRIIWIFWHNRVFLMPIVYRRHLRHRPIKVLTSASRDGALIARTVAHFGLGAVRGSSSKRAAAATAELLTCLETGHDIGITPDGPRGPRYQLAPGPIRLAQLTQTPLVSINLDYTRIWKLRSWDHFRIPKPFSRVTISFGPTLFIPPAADVETERLKVQAHLCQPHA